MSCATHPPHGYNLVDLGLFPELCNRSHSPFENILVTSKRTPPIGSHSGPPNLSSLRLCGFAYCGHFIYTELHSTWPSGTGFFHFEERF